MSHYYPDKGNKTLYYVEFGRGGKDSEFTVFKRQWLHTDDELEAIKAKDPKRYERIIMFNEVHPWNIFTAEYGAPGSMPDEAWVKFMVDSLNAAVEKSKGPKEIPLSPACLPLCNNDPF
jgi:hypothetical protein